MKSEAKKWLERDNILYCNDAQRKHKKNVMTIQTTKKNRTTKSCCNCNQSAERKSDEEKQNNAKRFTQKLLQIHLKFATRVHTTYMIIKII